MRYPYDWDPIYEEVTLTVSYTKQKIIHHILQVSFKHKNFFSYYFGGSSCLYLDDLRHRDTALFMHC